MIYKVDYTATINGTAYVEANNTEEARGKVEGGDVLQVNDALDTIRFNAVLEEAKNFDEWVGHNRILTF